MIDRRWLFICSCVALITSAFTFVVRGDVLQEMGNAFAFSQLQKGSLEGAVFTGMALSMLFGGFICDYLGMRKIMWLAFASHLFGSLGTIYAPHFTGSLNLFGQTYTGSDQSFYWMFFASVLMGFGNGFTEVAINPLVATLFPTQKTHYLNILHAWWPGGLVIGGLTAKYFVRGVLPEPFLGLEVWQTALWLIAIPTLIYGAMLLRAEFPLTERVESGVTTGAMLRECLRPMFLLWGVCMLLTAATELGPQKWQESVMTSTAGVSGTLILVYTSGMMFVLRHFAGAIAHQISPIGMLTCSAILAGIGLFLLSTATNAYTAFAYATIFGFGIAYFWPTMLGVTAERFAKGGALALALMGSVGNLAISRVLPAMGGVADHYQVLHVQERAPQLLPELCKFNKEGKPDTLDTDRIAVLEAMVAQEQPGATPVTDAALKEKMAATSARLQALSPPMTAGEVLQIAKSSKAAGFSMAFRWVSVLPGILVVLFGCIFLYDLSRGGYKPDVLSPKGAH